MDYIVLDVWLHSVVSSSTSISICSLVLDMWLIVKILFMVQYVEYAGCNQFQNLLWLGDYFVGSHGG